MSRCLLLLVAARGTSDPGLRASVHIHYNNFGVVDPTLTRMTQIESTDPRWTVEVGRDWDVLGPFPIHAREQHYLSPSYPLDLTSPHDPHDLQRSAWPSSYADNGAVTWSKARSDNQGNLKVSFPNIRWENLRATEGWAALQHHSVLRTVLTIRPSGAAPPAVDDPENAPYPPFFVPRLSVELLQGSYFTVTPTQHVDHLVPRWFAGNIYTIGRSAPQTLGLPYMPHEDRPTQFFLYVSGDYEIRLFGDPLVNHSQTPTLSLNIQVGMDLDAYTPPKLEEVATHHVACDFVDGYAFGNALGVGVKSVDGWWTIRSASLPDFSIAGLSVHLTRDTRLAPTQTRVVPLIVTQTLPVKDLQKLDIRLDAECRGERKILVVSLPIRQIPLWTAEECTPIKATYLFGNTMPTYFLLVPPKLPNASKEKPRPPLLALHGAGVDVVDQTFFADSLPRQERSWIVIPTGRTSWGLDWHGPSAQDAWNAVDALHELTETSASPWKQWAVQEKANVVLMGHSNGGQGAWWVAERYPDRVLGVIPAAGYVKSQAYVSLGMSRSAHFIDPSLRAILDSSLTADDNDLFVTNLVDTPVLAIHGGEDENVPTWHTRELVNTLRIWNPNADVVFREDKGKPHWYPDVLLHEDVQRFIDRVSTSEKCPPTRSMFFTLTTVVPAESGTMHGWRINLLQVPGRLARLHVTNKDGKVELKTTNVHAASVDLGRFGPIDTLSVNGRLVESGLSSKGILWLEVIDINTGIWRHKLVEQDVTPEAYPIQRFGRSQAILSTQGPIVLVVPFEAESPKLSTELSIALRIAHDLDTFHKLDALIMSANDAMDVLRGHDVWTYMRGNVVVIGGYNAAVTREIFHKSGSGLTWSEGSGWSLGDRSFNDPATGGLALQQHPWHDGGVSLVLMGSDDVGLEQAARLFPIRTGVALPDYVFMGKHADKIGAAGVEAAGYWESFRANNWKWRCNARLSWPN